MDVMDFRFKKFEEIIDTYSLINTVPLTAQKAGVSEADVSAALKIADIDHRVKRTPENVLPGKLLRPFINGDELEFLDKYNE